MKENATYTFKGVVKKQNPSNSNEYLVDPDSILLRQKRVNGLKNIWTKGVNGRPSER